MGWTPETRISSRSIHFLVEGLKALGHDLEQIAPPLAIPPASLHPTGTLSVAECVRLLDYGLRVEGPDVGIRAGMAIPAGALGLVDHLTKAAPTCRAALEDLARYFALVATGVHLTLREAYLTLEMMPLADPYRRLFAEITFTLIEERLSARTGQRFTAREIHFPWSPPPDRTALDARWPRLTFRADTCAMLCEPQMLETPLQTADSSLRHLLERYAQLELGPSAERSTIEGRVTDYLLAQLPGAPPSADQVARALGMSGRSLRRALQQESTTFVEIRDRCLRHIAEDALRDPDRSIGEVAWLLGYSEPSAFHRAFRRWTGTTPEGFRRHSV